MIKFLIMAALFYKFNLHLIKGNRLVCICNRAVINLRSEYIPISKDY